MHPDRRWVVARLDRLVTENRFTIAVVFPLVGAAMLVASALGLFPGPLAILAFNPLLILGGTLVMRLPLAATLAPLVDRRLGLGLAAVAAYTYGVEAVGVSTGVPYGEFAYGVSLGPMVAGIPLALPVFFLPLVLNAYLLGLLAFGTASLLRVPVTVAAVVAIDMVLDPAAVALGFWTFAESGAYYGVPLSNFAGWLLSAVVAVSTLELALDRAALEARLHGCAFALDDLVSFVLLWGTIAAAFGAWIPVAVAAGFAVALVRLGRVEALLWPLGRRQPT
ncbi:bisanhydrobacterioruberin hydratase [Halobacteriales archaeon Cl-PHB]